MFHVSAFVGKRWNSAQQHPVKPNIEVPIQGSKPSTQLQDQHISSVAASPVFPLKAGVSCFITEGFGEACKPKYVITVKSKNKEPLSSPGRFGFLTEPVRSVLLILNFTIKSMDRFFFTWRHIPLSKSYKWHAYLLIGAILFTLLISAAFGQTDVQNLAVIINALDKDDLNITSTLSLIDLDEPNEKRAVDREVLTIGDVPGGLLIHGHLAYISRFDWISGFLSDSILIVNLERREIVGEIPIEPGAYPQNLALVKPDKMYVTCDNVHQVHVIDIPNRNVTKIITDPSFNKTTGITHLNGKAYVTNPAWEWDAAKGASVYHQSSVTVIDTETDTVLTSIPMPINASGILNDGESTVIVQTTGDYNLISGNLVLIDGTTDEIIKTVDLKTTPGAFAINSQNQLFIQSGWQNPGLLIYDVSAQKWIRNKKDALAEFASGSGMTFGADGNLYITKPDWTGGGFSTVLVMGPDETLLKTYPAGHGTDTIGIVQIVPRREDVNDDGFVNLEDLTIVNRFFGDRGPGILADVNGDEVVNILDLVLIGQAL